MEAGLAVSEKTATNFQGLSLISKETLNEREGQPFKFTAYFLQKKQPFQYRLPEKQRVMG